MGKKPRILILGGAGYVGGHLTDLLLARGFPVTVYDSLVYETRFQKDVPFILGDVRDHKKLLPLLKRFDVVIALAAVVGDEACAIDSRLTREVNVESVRWLSKQFKGKIIFASTCSVYGASKAVLREDSKLTPLSLYAETKIEAEEILTGSKGSARHLIFRFATLFGTGDRYSRPRFDLAVNAFSKNAALRQTLRVFGGERWRPFVHVKDIAEAILFGLEHDLSGLYNISNRNYRIRDIPKMVRRVAKRPVRVESVALGMKDLRDYRVSADKLLHTGFRPKRTLEDGIREVYSLVQEGRIKDPFDPVYSNAAFRKTLK